MRAYCAETRRALWGPCGLPDAPASPSETVVAVCTAPTVSTVPVLTPVLTPAPTARGLWPVALGFAGAAGWMVAAAFAAVVLR